MKKILYLGSDPGSIQNEAEVTHLQLIEVIPKPYENFRWILADWEEYSRILFTSKHAVRIFSDLLKHSQCSPKHQIIAVGKTTGKELEKFGWKNLLVADQESQEGILKLLRMINWAEEDYVLMPRASRARGLLEQFFLERDIRHQVCDLYDTFEKKILLPDLEQFDEIFFTSPSTVTAFFSLITAIPHRPKLKAIGPITWQNLIRRINIHAAKNNR